MHNHSQHLEPARLILSNTRTLYEKYDAGRPDPFNVFTVLRSRSDEVNLHSRFLHALLDYREPGREKKRQNLKNFLETAGNITDFDIRDANVQREKDNIDLLITNPPWAVVIENKIWAGDQPKQLERYHQRVSDIPGIDEDKIHIFYLTPDGREASEDSAGSIKYKPISYKDHILPWLEACQRRAVNNPPLRESLAQYIEVIRSLTGLNIEIEHMNELQKLCLKENNLLLVDHLNEAYHKACICIVANMWRQMKRAMDHEFEGTKNFSTRLNHEISCVSENGNVDEEKIKEKVQQRNYFQWHGLYYPFIKINPSEKFHAYPSLGIELSGSDLWYGVRCDQENYKEYFDEIKKILNNGNDDSKSLRYWPWYRNAFDKLDIDHLIIGKGAKQWLWLNNEDNVKKCAKEIAQKLKEIWNKLPDDLKQDRE